MTDIRKAYYGLLKKTGEAFNKFNIKHIQETKGLSWNYSIAVTRIYKNSTLIIGFNAGAAKGFTHLPQSSIPDKNWGELAAIPNELGRMKVAYNRLLSYFDKKEVDQFIQTNFCFFRSPKDHYISHSDRLLATPLFIKLIQILEPNRIIGFSSALRDYLDQQDLITSRKELIVPSNQGDQLIVNGILDLGNKSTPIYLLPHPNYPLNQKAKDAAWDWALKDL